MTEAGRIKGHRELTREEVDMINEIKAMAEAVGNMVLNLEEELYTDKRSVALAKTNFQQAFMWAVRSIAKPEGFG